MLSLDGSAGSDQGTGQHMIVLKGELQRGEGERRQGIWYVWNAAERANRKPLTPVSNEINACSVSVVFTGPNQQGAPTEILMLRQETLIFSVANMKQFETQEGEKGRLREKEILQLLFTAMCMETRKYGVNTLQASQ